MKLLVLIRTLVCYLLCGIGLLVFIPPCFIIACLPSRYRYGNRLFFTLLGYFYTWVTYATLNPVRYEGYENLPTSPALFIANHQSSLDIPVLGSLCRGYSHTWLVLAYYVNTPVLGFFITRMFVPVDPSSTEKAAGSLRRVIRYIEEHAAHLIIFPEGGRHNDGRIHEFYEGFAVVAKRTKRPVIPVYLPTLAKIYPIYSFYVYSAPLDIIIGKPLYIQDDETESAFTLRVHNWFTTEQEKYCS
jgi:1-acyl-sn-glycerol-3-phosphate acyltransferase